MKGVKKFAKFIVVFAVIFGWVFSGWPQIWNFPPEVKEAQAAVSFVGSTSNVANNGANVTLTLSGLGLQQYDLVIAAYSIGDNDNVNFNMAETGATWIEVADLFSDDTYDANLGVYYKVMGASPDASVTFSGLGGTDTDTAAVAIAFRGVNATTPMDVTPTTATGLDTMHPNPPSIDHNNPSGIWTVIAGSNSHVLNAGSYTFPTGYTTNAISQLGDDTQDGTVGMGYRSSGVSDPEDPGVMTHSGTAANTMAWAAVTIALRPIVAPTVTTQAATNKEATTATCNGTITATGGANATNAGCEWDIDTGAPYANTASTAGDYGAVSFTQALTGLPSGTTIYARAFATNSAGTGYGSEVNFLTKPAAPTALNFTSVSATTLRLNWTAPTGAVSYKVERCTGTGCSSWLEIAAGVATVYYDDTGRTGNTVYRYQVRATNATGDSAYSSGAEQLMLPDTPGTPTFSGVTGTSITVTWSPSTGGSNNNYYVERAPDVSGSPGSWAEVGTNITSPWTNNTGLTCNTTYWYKVRGNNATGYGAYSGNASQITGSCNTAPSFSVIPNDSPDPVVAGYDVTFSGTANDSESNSWYLAVCKTDSITAANPPTCASSQTYCVSSAVASGSSNSCIWTSSGLGAQIWYAFACDNNASPLCSSNSNANSPVTVNAQSLTFSISGNAIDFGALSATAARFATTNAGSGGSASETVAHTLSASTNASAGYIITAQGATLTNSANSSFTISAITPSAVDVTLAGSKGTEQFGIRLSASGTGTATSPYNGAANFYAYNGTAAATSQAASGAGDGTSTTFSVYYASNISAVTEPGNYNANLTYTATGNF